MLKMYYITVFFTSRGKMNINEVEEIEEQLENIIFYKDNKDTRITIMKNKIDSVKIEKIEVIPESKEIGKVKEDKNAKKSNDRS
jgi:hypothetical protein